SLVEDARTTSSRPSTLMWTALTVRPWSAPATGTCSFSTTVTPSTVIVVFGAGWRSTLSGMPPTEIDVIVTWPVEPAHVLCDDDCTSPILMRGRSSALIRASCTDAVAVEVPGLTAVTTFAHSVCAVTMPVMVSTQGGATVVAPAVTTGPVSG